MNTELIILAIVIAALAIGIPLGLRIYAEQDYNRQISGKRAMRKADASTNQHIPTQEELDAAAKREQDLAELKLKQTSNITGPY